MHFDGTITLGNALTAAGFLVMALFAWRDLSWRITNLEKWRVEHMVDADARDSMLKKLDKILDHVRWQTERILGGPQSAPPNH